MGMIVQVYKSPLGDCTNGGISGMVTSLCLTNVAGPFDPGPDRPAARLAKRRHGNVVIYPEGLGDDGGSMFGGNFAYSSDGRFTEAVRRLAGIEYGFPVAIHDRVEG